MSDLADLILRFLFFALLHSVLALRTLQSALRRLAPRSCRFYRLTYNLVALATFGWVMAAWPLSPVLYVVPGAGSLVFHGLQGLLLVLMGRCAAQTGLGDFLGFRQVRGDTAPPLLVTTGCYGHVRHPLYSLAVLFLLFNPVMTVKWLLLTALSTLYFVIGALVEERRLLEEFGGEYRRYRERVPMFIPHAGGRHAGI